MKNLSFFILGIATALLFPPFFFFPLGFIVFPILCFTIEKNYKNKFINLWLEIFIYGIGFFGSLLFWIQNPFFVIQETSNIFFISFLFILIISIIFSLIFNILKILNTFLPTIFLVPLIFVSFETIISVLAYGFPWITFSLISSNVSFLSLFLKNFGTLINSYLIIQIFCLPFLFFSNILDKKYLYLFFSIVVIPLITVLFINNVILNNVTSSEKKLNLEIFQINKNIALSSESNDLLLLEILNLISKSKADILLFAENNYPFLIKDINFQNIKKKLKNNQSVIIGGTRFNNNSYYNTLFYISKFNTKYFDKKILVPFGEFLPFRKYLQFFTPISGQNDFKSGNSKRLVEISKNLNFIPVVCYEIIFYWKLINQKNLDSNFMINITNDIWFGDLLGPYQHLYLTKLRAIEFNKPIIRISNNGISSIIDKDGNFISKIKLNEKKSINTSLDVRNTKSFYYSHKFLNWYFSFIVLIIIFITLKKLYEKKRNYL